MNHRQMCVSNLRYKQPSMSQQRSMKNLLKYLTYRDSRDDYVPQISGNERWVDQGMGHSVAQIANRCTDYQSKHVLAFSLVINPNPDLIEMIEREERERFVRELTEKTVTDFFIARDLDTGIEYSWVMHHRVTVDQENAGRHNPHTHVVLPGTFYDADEGRRVPLYFSKNKQINHIELLHDITEQNMGQLLERYIGLDWEQTYDRLHPEPEVESALDRLPEVDMSIFEPAPKPEPPVHSMSFDIDF